MKKLLDFFAVLFLSIALMFSFLALLASIGFVISIICDIVMNGFTFSKTQFYFDLLDKLLYMIDIMLGINPKEDLNFISIVFIMFLLLIISIFIVRKFYKELCNIIKNKTKPSLFFQVILFILLFYTICVFMGAIYIVFQFILVGKFLKIHYIVWVFDFIISAVIFYKLREKFLSKKNIFFQSLVAILLFIIIVPLFMCLIISFPFIYILIGNKFELLMNKFWMVLYIIFYIPIFMLINKTLKKYANEC